jgi:hypothetical protein
MWWRIAVLIGAVAIGGCGADGSAPGRGGASGQAGDAETAEAPPPPCPFTDAEITQQTSIPVVLLSENDGSDICFFGTSGSEGDIGVDNSASSISVSGADDWECDYENIEPGFLPYQGGHRAAPEYGEGAWKVVLPSSETGPPGYEGGAYFKLGDACVEVYLFHRGSTSEAETEQVLDELVSLATS